MVSDTEFDSNDGLRATTGPGNAAVASARQPAFEGEISPGKLSITRQDRIELDAEGICDRRKEFG